MNEINSDSVNFNGYTSIKKQDRDDPLILRGTGRTKVLILEAITCVYKGINTDMYFLTRGELKSNVQFVQDIFKILNCPILVIRTFPNAIVVKVKVRQKEVKLCLRAKVSFNPITYKGIHNKKNNFRPYALFQ